jgi:hypothetical protein
MKYKRLCNFTHSGIEFEHSGANIVINGKQSFTLNSHCLNKTSNCKKLKCLYAGGDCDPFYDAQRAVHSDFLVHWTGRDIDNEYDPAWEKRNDTRLNENIVSPYIDRLKNILKYGLWMTSSKSDLPLIYRNKIAKRPLFYRTCFSELKLSEVRVHAKRFGRLGIGVKRPFVMNRKGAPVVYFREEFENWFFASFKKNKNDKIPIPSYVWWAYYLKSMNEGDPRGGYLHYANFQESEWRIIYNYKIRKKFGEIPGIMDFDKVMDNKFYSYLQKYKVPVSKQPRYLLPLDKWFAFIIYPNLAVKTIAERMVWGAVKKNKIKCKFPTKKIDWPKRSAEYENYSLPFGIDLDACRNF